MHMCYIWPEMELPLHYKFHRMPGKGKRWRDVKRIGDDGMNRSLPGIGMRIIKSALAVAICYLINILRDGNGIVFYSQLAALWCIQMYRSNTIKNAIQRTIGTCVGATYGLVCLMIQT